MIDFTENVEADRIFEMNSHNYACFDDLALLSPTHKCSNVGLFKHNENVLTDFVDYLETRRE